MRVAQRAPTPLQCLAVQRLRLAKLPLSLQQDRQVVDGGQRGVVRVAQRAPLLIQRLAAQRLRLAKLSLILQQERQIVD